ncbi:MAG: hypothetical protein KBD01_20400 [Acidobacteria bacterium]|nr:hypothetical protein [Acidobacteriota bacterium]
MARNKRSELSQARRFALALLVLFGALGAWSLWRGHPLRGGVVLGLAVAAPLLAFGWTRAWLALFRAWMAFAERLSRVSTAVLLTLVYFLLFTVVAVLRRLFGGRPLDVTWRDGRASYWIDKPATEPTIARYSKQY